MRIVRACNAPESTGIDIIFRALPAVSTSLLRELVETLAMPRHYEAEPANNRLIGDRITERLTGWGYRTLAQGPHRNIVALPRVPADRPLVLVGAHYDSVPGTPGADDNASAVAAMLACAGLIAEQAPAAPVCFVAFNREEDGLVGSEQFVRQYLPTSGLSIAQAHVLEMVGFCRHEPGTQQVPPGLPLRLTDVGDFLGIIANRDSNRLLDSVLRQARTYLPDFNVLGLKVYCGLERYFPVLRRSDHASFWQSRLPALMWTDTAEFRNPHYHRPTDTPETLDFTFLRQVTQLLAAQVLASVLNPATG